MKTEEIKRIKTYYDEFLTIWQEVKYNTKFPHKIINNFLNYIKKEFSFPVVISENLETMFLNTVWNFLHTYKKVGLRFIEYWLRYNKNGLKKNR